MNYFNKILLTALVAMPLLFAATKEHTVKIELPEGTRFASDEDIASIKPMTTCQFLTPDIAFIAEELGVSARIARLGLPEIAQQWGLLDMAERWGVNTASTWLGLPAVAKCFGFFKDEVTTTTEKRIWTAPILEKLTWDQLLGLTRNFEIGIDELLMHGLRRVLQKPKND